MSMRASAESRNAERYGERATQLSAEFRGLLSCASLAQNSTSLCRELIDLPSYTYRARKPYKATARGLPSRPSRDAHSPALALSLSLSEYRPTDVRAPSIAAPASANPSRPSTERHSLRLTPPHRSLVLFLKSCSRHSDQPLQWGGNLGSTSHRNRRSLAATSARLISLQPNALRAR